MKENKTNPGRKIYNRLTQCLVLVNDYLISASTLLTMMGSIEELKKTVIHIGPKIKDDKSQRKKSSSNIVAILVPEKINHHRGSES